MNAPKMAATAIIINCSVNQNKNKNKNLDCFADEKTETLGKGRRFLCSLREKKKCIYKCQWDVGGTGGSGHHHQDSWSSLVSDKDF